MDSSIIYRFTMDYNSGLFKEYQVLCTIVLSMNNIMYSMTMIIMIIIPWILVWFNRIYNQLAGIWNGDCTGFSMDKAMPITPISWDMGPQYATITIVIYIYKYITCNWNCTPRQAQCFCGTSVVSVLSVTFW